VFFCVSIVYSELDIMWAPGSCVIEGCPLAPRTHQKQMHHVVLCHVAILSGILYGL
jgi:hypothetical protein